MIKNKIYPQFKINLLHPRYWLTWLSIIILYLLVLLPYPILFGLGKKLGSLSRYIFKRRVKITRKNLALCFPHLSERTREEWLHKNFQAAGIAIFETGMAWFWPDWRIKKLITDVGAENILKNLKQKRGVVLLGVHFFNLELGARAIGLCAPGVGVYRPHNNKLIEWVQTRGRLRSNKYMLDRKNVKGMITALKQGEMLWYAPDHDYGLQNSTFVPFFAMEKAATTIGTSILMRKGNQPALIPFALIRDENNLNYRLLVKPEAMGFPLDDETKAAAFVNKLIEQEIIQAPTQYMWLHRRFKTRPQGEAPIY